MSNPREGVLEPLDGPEAGVRVVPPQSRWAGSCNCYGCREDAHRRILLGGMEVRLCRGHAADLKKAL